MLFTLTLNSSPPIALKSPSMVRSDMVEAPSTFNVPSKSTVEMPVPIPRMWMAVRSSVITSSACNSSIDASEEVICVIKPTGAETACEALRPSTCTSTSDKSKSVTPASNVTVPATAWFQYISSMMESSRAIARASSAFTSAIRSRIS